jgi:hypothetical protein
MQSCTESRGLTGLESNAKLVGETQPSDGLKKDLKGGYSLYQGCSKYLALVLHDRCPFEPCGKYYPIVISGVHRD